MSEESKMCCRQGQQCPKCGADGFSIMNKLYSPLHCTENSKHPVWNPYRDPCPHKRYEDRESKSSSSSSSISPDLSQEKLAKALVQRCEKIWDTLHGDWMFHRIPHAINYFVVEPVDPRSGSKDKPRCRFAKTVREYHEGRHSSSEEKIIRDYLRDAYASPEWVETCVSEWLGRVTPEEQAEFFEEWDYAPDNVASAVTNSLLIEIEDLNPELVSSLRADE